jgi:hypothetical protein
MTNRLPRVLPLLLGTDPSSVTGDFGGDYARETDLGPARAAPAAARPRVSRVALGGPPDRRPNRRSLAFLHGPGDSATIKKFFQIGAA